MLFNIYFGILNLFSICAGEAEMMMVRDGSWKSE